VVNRPIYVALAVTVDGTRDILGLWAGEHGDGEGAKYWLRVLTEIKNRGTKDCLIVVCDGLTGLPDAVAAVWPQTIVQTCVVHLLRNSFKYASRRDWAAIARDLKPIYTAPSDAAALDRFAGFSDVWEAKHPAIARLWTNAWWVGAVPAVRHPYPHRYLDHERDPCPRPLRERAGRDEMCVPAVMSLDPMPRSQS